MSGGRLHVALQGALQKGTVARINNNVSEYVRCSFCCCSERAPGNAEDIMGEMQG